MPKKIKEEIIDSPEKDNESFCQVLFVKEPPIDEETRRVSARIRKRSQSATEIPSEVIKVEKPDKKPPKKLKVPKTEPLEGHSSDSGIDEKYMDNLKKRSTGNWSCNETEMEDFKLGDLVWGKVKKEFWPAKVATPPRNRRTTRKNLIYLYFFGSKKRSWVSKNHIVHHSEKMVDSCPKKMKPLLLQKAIINITRYSKQASKKSRIVTIKEEEEEIIPPISEPNPTTECSAATAVEAETEFDFVDVEEIANEPIGVPVDLPQQDDSSWANVMYLMGASSSSEPEQPRVSLVHPRTVSHAPVSVWRPSPVPAFDVMKVNEFIKAKKFTPTAKKIGFIGLGLMGRGIVKNLLNSGHDVTVWNRSSEKCFVFVSKAGAFHVATPSDVVARCDIVFCCVSDPKAVKSVVFGRSGVLHGIRNSEPGSKGYVELTSMDPTTSREIARAISKAGGKYLEAPMSGSRQLAEEGGLVVLGAGDKYLFRACESCFLAFCKHAYYLGEVVGSAARMGLILSMIKGTVLAALAEALALVERCKLSPANFLEILDLGEFNCPMLTEKGKAIIQRNFATNNSLKHQQKSMNMALSLGDECLQSLPTTSAANEIYKHAKLLRYAEHDSSAVFLGVKY